MSSAKILGFDSRFIGRSLMYTKKNKKPERREGPADVAITECSFVPSTGNVGGTNFCVLGFAKSTKFILSKRKNEKTKNFQTLLNKISKQNAS